MIQEAIANVYTGKDMSYEMAETVMDEIMNGKATPAQNASLLTALHMKGETIDEITAFAKVMRKHCCLVETNGDIIDIVGTGGDCAGTFNISTISAIVTSSVGVNVAKHGNRAASSKCGTADVLESLGVNLLLDSKENTKVLEKTGMCFLFAQKYHTAMKFVAGVRREIKIPTVFNILGPLANPARANLQLLGVYDESLVEPLAHVLHNLGVKRAMVVYGRDKLDEISLSNDTFVCEINNDTFKTYVIKPEEYGFVRCKKEDLVGGTPKENADIARNILNGEKSAKTDAVILNAGAAIHIAKQVTIKEGIEMAREAIYNKKALEQLEKFVECTKNV